MSQFEPQVLKYLPADRLVEHLKQLHPGMAVTHGHHESLVPGYINDLEWNFYDELHRQCVHDTYHGLYKGFCRAGVADQASQNSVISLPRGHRNGDLTLSS